MKIRILGIVFSTLLSAGIMQAQSVAMAAPDAARQYLNDFFTKVDSLQGTFSQQVYSKKGQVIQNASGKLYLNRPGKFRWVYSSPDPQTIVADGKNIWIYDEDLEQVTIKPIRAAISAAPIALLTNKQKPDAQFIVKAMSSREAGLSWFNLVPRRKTQDFKELQLGVDQSGVRRMVMHDQLGQKTVIQLNVQKNQPIRGETFYFKIPPGVDVIGKAS